MNKTTPEIELVLAKNDPVLKDIIHQIPKPKIVSSKHVFHDLNDAFNNDIIGCRKRF